MISSVAIINISPTVASDIEYGRKLFTANCAGCHSKGSNVLNPFKTLQQQSLSRDGYDSQEKVIEIIQKGKSLMPAYSEFISPKGNLMPAKLTNNEIEAVAAFVLQQARDGWIDTAAPDTSNKNCDEYPGC